MPDGVELRARSKQTEKRILLNYKRMNCMKTWKKPFDSISRLYEHLFYEKYCLENLNPILSHCVYISIYFLEIFHYDHWFIHVRLMLIIKYRIKMGR